MNSCLYRCEVMHHRLFPKEHRFTYNVFMFYIDLDELEVLNGKLSLFSCNNFNWFNFRDRDHLKFPRNEAKKKSVKQNVLDYLQSFGVDLRGGRIMLLTN